MSKKALILSVLSSVVTCLVLMRALAVSPASPEHADNAYERVMQSGTLRCGYALWPLYLDKDPNTGRLSGIFYDYLQALGDAAQLKIEWTEEVSFGDIVEALRSNRVDAICSGAWTNPVRGKFVDFVTPIFYQAISAYVRSGDQRFDAGVASINSPAVTISVVDGESASTIAKADFPQAKIISMPKGTENSQMLLNVLHNKADVTFADASLSGAFLANNPGALREVPVKFPLRVFGAPLIVKKGEAALRETLNTATQQLLWTGAIERILRKYEKHPGMFLRAAAPFERGVS